MIRSKNNERITQAGNDESSDILRHNCEAKWDGLQCRNMLSNKSCQHGRSKSTHQEQSNGENESEARKKIPGWLHQELTNYLK